MWSAVEALSQTSSAVFSTSYASWVVRHFVASSRAPSIKGCSLGNSVCCRVAHRCRHVIAQRSHYCSKEIHRARYGPLVQCVGVSASSNVIPSAPAVSFRSSRIRVVALSSLQIQTHRHSFNLTPNHRLVATGLNVVASSNLIAPAPQPERWASE